MSCEEFPPTSAGEREALEFLGKGRKLRGLSPAQLQRIEQRLAVPQRPHRGKRMLPVLAAATVALLAGAAVASVVDFSRLPLVGSLFPSRPARLAPKARRPPMKPVATPPGDAIPSPTPAAPAAPVVLPPAGELAPAAKRTLASERSSARGRVPVSGPALAMERPEKLPALTPPDRLPNEAPYLAPAGGAAAPGPSLGSGAGPAARAEAKEHVVVREEFVAPSRTTPRAPAMPMPAEDPISAESRSFSAALGQWHRDHNAEAALAALDLHERRFRYGQMRLEAALLRAEILLQQGREREALGLLDRVSLSGLPRGRELHTVRGELRVKQGRCREGRGDLEHVLANGRTDTLGRRAARALVLCP